jgi:hypothetical protein
MKTTFTLLPCLGFALLLANCQKKSEGPSSALANKRWMLTEVDGTPTSLSSYSFDYDSFIQFNNQDNSIAGLAACSTIKGSYALEEAGQRLTFNQLITTPGSCSNLGFATKYLGALPLIQRYKIQGRNLLLYDNASTNPRLIFQTDK